MIYYVYFYGGPKDGEWCVCYRPYFELLIDGNLYRIDGDSRDVDSYVFWIDDNTRGIALYYKGKATELSQDE